MLDRWIIGVADRMSPEAPVPVLTEKYTKYSAGGAANLAINLQNLHDDITLYGAVSPDDDGYKIINLIGQTKIESQILFDSNQTTTKTRLVGQGGQHILRWDREETYTGNLAIEFTNNLKKDETVVISDYNKGTVTQMFMAQVLEKTLNVFVDPKQQPEIYTGCFVVKPNMKEYTEWFGEFTVESAMKKCKLYKWKWLIVTDGANGVHVVGENDYHHYKEDVREVADVTGAGDTFLAVLVYLYIYKKLTIPQACELACYASARNVEKRGVVPVTEEDLNRGIVWTNGVFDILHTGHLKLLRHAHTLGKRLVVGINSDASVKRLKGDLRPINDEFTRKQQLEQLGFIDEVVVFDEDTPLETILQIKPDIIVKGGDYTVEEVVGHEYAKVDIFPIVEGHSTTRIIERMKK